MKMKLLTANQKIPNKIPIVLKDLIYIKSMTPLKELLDGESLNYPIEVKEHIVSEVPRYGPMGIPYIEKESVSYTHLTLPTKA